MFSNKLFSEEKKSKTCKHDFKHGEGSRDTGRKLLNGITISFMIAKRP